MRTGAFIMLDALGFKEKSKNDPGALRLKMRGLLKNYREWLSDTAKKLDEKGLQKAKPRITFLSDTIAIGFPDALEKASGPSRPARTLALGAMLANDIVRLAGTPPCPLAYRGCISYGDFDSDGPFIMGPAVNDTAEHHELGEAAAVWLTPTALSIWDGATSLVPPDVAMTLLRYPVPLRSGATFETMVANPFFAFRAAESREDWIRAVLAEFKGPMSVTIKRQNTARLLRALDDAYPKNAPALIPSSAQLSP